MPDHSVALALLEQDGLLRRERGRYRTTRKWQAAMARAAHRLWTAGDPGVDLRIPIVTALFDVYGETLSDEDVAARTAAMLPVEDAELHPPLDPP